MNEWFKVSTFLYSGIAETIRFYKKLPDLANEKNLLELKEAVEIYSNNCIVSSKYLREQYDDLMKSLNQ